MLIWEPPPLHWKLGSGIHLHGYSKKKKKKKSVVFRSYREEGWKGKAQRILSSETTLLDTPSLTTTFLHAPSIENPAYIVGRDGERWVSCGGTLHRKDTGRLGTFLLPTSHSTISLNWTLRWNKRSLVKPVTQYFDHLVPLLITVRCIIINLNPKTQTLQEAYFNWIHLLKLLSTTLANAQCYC